MAKLRGNAESKCGSKTTSRLGNLDGKAEWAKLEGTLPRGWGAWMATLRGNVGSTAGSKTTSRLGNLECKAQRQSLRQNCSKTTSRL